MPSKKRIWYPGCVYHITARGIHKNDIFHDETDFREYMIMMKECLKFYEYYNYELICYCLMTNHVHLLIKANSCDLSHLIKRTHSMYAKYFNKKYNYIGHLFQDKYYSNIIEDDKQMLEASRYIHLNPVRAKIVEKPEEYKNSSYSMYIGLEAENLISSSNLLDYFQEEEKRERYKSFVESKMEKITPQRPFFWM